MPQLILIRHGQSQWNLENRFTGLTDVDLTPTGVEQAKQAGRLLKAEGYDFDVAYTSVLKRATRTLWHTLDELDRTWLPVVHSWRLNERHYGALQGLNKADMAKQYGDEQVLIWRRSYDTPPPALEPTDPRASYDDPRYANVPRNEIPLTECLKDTVARVMPLWNESIAPDIQSGKRVVIAAHGNSIRALVKYLDQISDDDIVGLNIPNGTPLVYELDADLRPLRYYYLGDQEAIAASLAAVASMVLPSVVTVRVPVEGSVSLGSGFVASAEGHIITNDHVVSGGSGVASVIFDDGTSSPAKVIGADPESDVAVLQVQRKEVHPALLGDSDAVVVGDPVVAVGSPKVRGRSVSR